MTFEWKKNWEENLAQLRDKNLYRQLREIENQDGVRGFFSGKPVTLFCGNDYLGLSRHPRVKAAAIQAIEKMGVGAGAARLTSGSASAHRKLEEKIATHKGFERALVFSAGYLANLGALTAIADEKTEIIFDKLCHASLIDAIKLSGAAYRIFPHGDLERCEALLSKSEVNKKIILVESVFGMDGDVADFEKLVEIKKRYGALLFVDDAHGTGVIETPHEDIDVLTGTLSKAVGSIGGYVVASAQMIDVILNRARTFLFATALPPMICEAAHAAFCVMEEEPALKQKLWQNIQTVYYGLKELKFDVTTPQSAVLPVILGDEKKALDAFQKLLDQGIFVPAIRYPTVPKGKARLRITVSALHSAADIQKLFEAMKQL